MKEKSIIKISLNTLIFLIVTFFVLVSLIIFFILNNNKYKTKQINGGTVLDAISSGKILSYENTTKLVDKNNNFISIPKGFKVLNENNATTVDKGIVIEDINGNQYVWVPVGTINTDDNQKVEIIFGRYDDFIISENGPKPVQIASMENYKKQIAIKNNFFECDSSSKEYKNTKSKNLKEFISSTLDNGGYYIGRYECGIKGTTKTTIDANLEENGNYKGSKDDLYNKNISIGIQSGLGVWNYISQENAAKISRKIYNNDVNTDLINSYAWDTAIIFIEKCGNKANSLNYSNSKLDDNIMYQTGAFRKELNDYDEQCNIFDLSSNVREWTTESSNFKSSSGGLPFPIKLPYVTRGAVAGFIDYQNTISHAEKFDDDCTIYRNPESLDSSTIGFRVILYI